MSDELLQNETVRIPEVSSSDYEPPVQVPVKKKHLRYRKYRALVEPAGIRALRIYNTIFYWVLVLLIVVAFFFIGKRFMAYCEESFGLYEQSQLSVACEDVMKRLNDADAPTLAELLPSEQPLSGAFDSGYDLMMEKYAALASAQLTSKEVRSADEGHAYNLYADGTPVGKFRIVSAGQEKRLGLLVMDRWEYAGGEVYFGYPVYARSFTVPEGFTVTVNGIALGEEYRVGEREEIADLRYLAEFEPMPGMVSYRVEGLLLPPQLEITDNNGEPVSFDRDAESIVLPARWNPSEPPEELAALAIDTAKFYGEYMLRDRSLREVQTILIPDSFLWNSVKNSDPERQFVDSHRIDGYENEQVTDFIRYSDTCFSCRVSMTRNLFALHSGLAVPDVVDNYYFFVQLDLTDDGADNATWYLCDTFGAG